MTQEYFYPHKPKPEISGLEQYSITTFCLFVLAATVAKGRVKPGQQQNDGLDQTFGDDERKCVKEFKEAYTSFSKVWFWY